MRLAERLAARQEMERAAGALVPEDERCRVVHADCRAHDWPEVDAIVCDPPWEYTGAYRWCAGFARDKLRDGGLLFVQTGQHRLPEVYPIFGALQYVWTLALVYLFAPRGKLCGRFLHHWRPVLVSSKGQAPYSGPITDTFTVKSDKKDWHDWQQPLEPFRRWIGALTPAGALVADPFCGSGTIGVACKLTGRPYLGTELDGKTCRLARKRIHDAK